MTPQKRYTQRFPEKYAAHQAVRTALVTGRLSRPEYCSVCKRFDEKGSDGRTIIHAHHHAGYDKPLDVVWLCAACHAKEDKRASGEATGRAKITASIASIIRRKHNPKAHWKSPEGSYRQMAREFGISPRMVKRIVKGENWIDAALSQDTHSPSPLNPPADEEGSAANSQEQKP